MKAAATAMISSTFLDLPAHREKTLEACHRMGFRTNAMEHTTAADRTTLAQSMRMVSESNIYILILGFRYGTIPSGKDELLTVLEFRRARQLDLPCFVFCIADDHPVKKADFELGPGAEKLARFKDEVRTTGLVQAEFSSAEQLMTLVIQSLADERDRLSVKNEKKAWRSTFPRPPEPWAVHPYTLMQNRFADRPSIGVGRSRCLDTGPRESDPGTARNRRDGQECCDLGLVSQPNPKQQGATAAGQFLVELR